MGVGVGILYVVYQNQATAFLENCQMKGAPPEDCVLIDKIIEDFRSVNYFWVLLVLICFTISNLSRAFRWRMLLRSMGYRPGLFNAFASVVIMYLANLFLPRIGEIVRSATLSKYEKIPIEKVIGTVAVGRVIDVLSLLIVTGLALLFEYDKLMKYFEGTGAATPDDEAGGGGILIWLLLGLGCLAGIAWIFRDKLQQSAIFQKILNLVKGFWEGIQTIMKLERPWLFVLHSINIWVMYFLMSYICFFAFAPTAHLGPGAGLMVFLYGSLGIVIPSPGGMGSYQWLVVQALALYGINENDAFSFANIIFFSVQIGSNIVLGILAYILLPLVNKNYDPVMPETNAS